MRVVGSAWWGEAQRDLQASECFMRSATVSDSAASSIHERAASQRRQAALGVRQLVFMSVALWTCAMGGPSVPRTTCAHSSRAPAQKVLRSCASQVPVGVCRCCSEWSGRATCGLRRCVCTHIASWHSEPSRARPRPRPSSLQSQRPAQGATRVRVTFQRSPAPAPGTFMVGPSHVVHVRTGIRSCTLSPHVPGCECTRARKDEALS